MITILNRKELCTTYDLQKQAQVRDILGQNNIDYIVKTVNRKSSSPLEAGTRVRTGTLGEDFALENEYVIYVKKEDYDLAYSLI
ncbi:MAG TPA: hypothetical protein IAC14_09090 [Candidatus Scybalomonas excrementigallinarum]|nr:hypothetical protein [Candidatus Scybalomonas excrementigallinarum]